MQLKTFDERLSIGGQIAPEDLAELKARGFRSIICNRPDDEDYGQPSFAKIAEAARAHGLETRHIPVSGRPGEVQATAFARALDELPGPVFAYCRSGGRAGALAAMTGR
ncbi:TIGR01244 family sulfur transferase [Rubellimicrobium roseum]|uniref:TIGR01244 family phosphatase n=1 Tax=Rubellimicrobium roseum TaxID=687525 RepID=A0A5C4N4G1_9RHOB|nr:TIGR01244 family sulfur transferase [Rubellimicrobium roseum]TNC62549.1 TIGR01244 family phosphatase [Rubellimicrobium roseum]